MEEGLHEESPVYYFINEFICLFAENRGASQARSSTSDSGDEEEEDDDNSSRKQTDTEMSTATEGQMKRYGLNKRVSLGFAYIGASKQYHYGSFYLRMGAVGEFENLFNIPLFQLMTLIFIVEKTTYKQ